MDIPDHGINRAHRFSRKAADCERLGKYSLAKKFHQLTIDLLNTIAKTTDYPPARASFLQQAQQHQMSLQLCEDREQFRKNFKHLKYQEGFWKTLRKMSNTTGTRSGMIEKEIFRKISQHDSLLKCLINERDKSTTNTTQFDTPLATEETENKRTCSLETLSNVDSNVPFKEMGSSSRVLPYSQATRIPKNDKIVIEELMMCNTQLKELIYMLAIEKEKLEQENQMLRLQLGEQTQINEYPNTDPPKMLN